MQPPSPAVTPAFAEAARFWLRLGFVSFGGPAGQIAILHREVVERRRWLGEREFTDALNFCMLLPGPEALQLAIYLGWRLHGIRGGLVAGLGFIGPAIVLLLGLSWLYARFGSLPGRDGRAARSEGGGAGAGAAGAAAHRPARARLATARRRSRSPRSWRWSGCACRSRRSCWLPGSWGLRAPGGRRGRSPLRRPLCATGRRCRVLAVGSALWLAPLLAVAATLGPQSLWSRLYLFFTQAALVTFGGAYAVLGYVTQHLVQELGWLTAQQSVAGLALAETTPGPLVIVLQFMGFMAGWNQPGAAVPGGGRDPRGAARVLGDVPAVVRVHLPGRAVSRARDPRAARRRGAGGDHRGGRRHHRHARPAARAGGGAARADSRTACAGPRSCWPRHSGCCSRAAAWSCTGCC